MEEPEMQLKVKKGGSGPGPAGRGGRERRLGGAWKPQRRERQGPVGLRGLVATGPCGSERAGGDKALRVVTGRGLCSDSRSHDRALRVVREKGAMASCDRVGGGRALQSQRGPKRHRGVGRDGALEIVTGAEVPRQDPAARGRQIGGTPAPPPPALRSPALPGAALLPPLPPCPLFACPAAWFCGISHGRRGDGRTDGWTDRQAGRQQPCLPQPVTDKFTESMYVLANEPSVALYRLQEHVRRSLPELAQHKSDMQSWEEQSQGAIYTVEYACSAIKNMTDSSVYFKSIDSLLKHAIAMKDQLNAAQGRSTVAPQAKNPPASS